MSPRHGGQSDAWAAGAIASQHPERLGRVLDRVDRIANRRLLCALGVAALVLSIRLSLLPWLPVPEPHVHDEFSHLFVADTLASGRLASPTHPFWRHFETVYILHQPTYSSIYVPGQGALLAFGQVVLGHPWYAVWLSVGVLSGLLCWMFYQLLPPRWALAGGLVVGLRFAIDSPWTNSYWGGSLCAIGGTLLFASLLRMLETAHIRHAILGGLGWAITWFTRPYESLILGGMVGLFLARTFLVRKDQPWRSKRVLLATAFASVAVLAIGASGYYNYRVTNDPTLYPYQVSQRVFGFPQGFYWQEEVPPGALRFKAIRDVYEWQRQQHAGGQSLSGWARGLRRKAYWFEGFFLRTPFLIALIALPLACKDARARLLALTCLVALAASSMYPFFYPHYLAAYTGPFFVLVLSSLRAIAQLRLRGKAVGFALVVLLLAWDVLLSVRPIGPPSFRGAQAPQVVTRSPVERSLQQMGGKHLVFVRYGPRHDYHREWVYNAADIDNASIVWAREIDPVADQALVRYYPGRRAWAWNADARPMRLEPWDQAIPTAARP